MSNLEREALRGRLAGAQRFLRDETMKADGAAILLRREISQANRIEDFNADKIAAFSAQLVGALRNMEKYSADVDRLEDALNG